MDALRIEIWDLLFRAKHPKSIGDIIEIVDRENDEVRVAVQHEWFTINDDMVSIALRAGGS